MKGEISKFVLPFVQGFHVGLMIFAFFSCLSLVRFRVEICSAYFYMNEIFITNKKMVSNFHLDSYKHNQHLMHPSFSSQSCDGFLL